MRAVTKPALSAPGATPAGEMLSRLETYYDTVPRPLADVEEHGPLTLFVAREGWPYYARPRLGGGSVTADDVRSVLERQRELDVPRALEWVHETTPSLLGAAREANLPVQECPLLVLDGEPVLLQSDVQIRVVPADDPELGLVRAAIHVGFFTHGTAVGTASVAERDAAQAADPEAADRTRTMVEAGLSVLVGAFDPVVGAVGGGSHNPRGDTSEIVGVAVLPAFRRRGVARAVTAVLARDARAAGVATVFCSAQDDAVARVYLSVGFRRVGTACIAELD